MSTVLPLLDGPGDAELISAVRGGDTDAYGELYRRHVEAARRLARQVVAGPDVDDLVSEAFAKVLVVLQRGGGPDLAFRAYLLTAVRRLHVDRIRASSRLHTTDDLEPFDPGVPFRDTAVEGFENATAAKAFASLPERWQMVLWHTEVEGQRPADVAPLLGMSANSVSALAYRAREGLRQAFVSMHAQASEDDECAWTHEHLGAHIRGGASRRDAARVERHLEECRPCTALWLELTEVNSQLAGVLAPLLLGGAAAAYVGASGGVAAPAGLLVLLGRARDLVAAHAPATAVAGVAAVGAVGGLVLMTTLQHTTGPAPSAGGRPATVASGSTDPSATPGPRRHAPARRGTPAAAPSSGSGPSSPTPVAGRSPGLTSSASSPSSPSSPSSSPGGSPSSPPPGSPAAGGHGPSDPPSGPPSDPGPTPVDLSVHAQASSSTGVAHRVEVSVTGLPSGGTGMLRITTDSPAVAVTLDRRCGLLQLGSATCAVTTSPATYTFLVVPSPTAPTTLTFTVVPDDSMVETRPSDNTVTVVLTR